MKYRIEKDDLVLVGESTEDVFRLGLIANKFSKVNYRRLEPKSDKKDEKEDKKSKKISTPTYIEISLSLSELVDRVAFLFQNKTQ